MDIRAAHTFELAGKETIIGLSLNNNPGVQDPFNTMPVWGFPYTSSALAFGLGGAGTLINGGLEQRVTGLSAYTFWNNLLYAEIGTYRSLSPTMQSKFGLGRRTTSGRLGGGTVLASGRLPGPEEAGLQRRRVRAQHLAAAGPQRAGTQQVQRPRRRCVVPVPRARASTCTVNTSFIRERQTRDAWLAAGEADNRKGHLNEFKLNGSYHYDQTWGATVGRFLTTGTADGALYAAGNGDFGFANGRPTAPATSCRPTGRRGARRPGAPRGPTCAWAPSTPMLPEFNGAKRNYDGNGRDAKDNNTLFLFAWTSF
jgi:hypothetical protein